MLYALGLWLALAPLTLLAVWAAVYWPQRTRDERGAVFQSRRHRPRGRHRKGL